MSHVSGYLECLAGAVQATIDEVEDDDFAACYRNFAPEWNILTEAIIRELTLRSSRSFSMSLTMWCMY